MSLCKVGDVDVVADPCAVGGGIVVAKHMQLFQAADSDLSDIRDKVIGYTVWILPDSAAFMCADRVEITKQDRIKR